MTNRIAERVRHRARMQWLLTLARLMVVFGFAVLAQGDTEVSAAQEMGTGWRQIVTDNAPAARHDHVLVAAGDSRTVVLFGGRTNRGDRLGDTWLLDLTTDTPTWREVATSSAPEARFGSAAAWDAARGRVLLFAGQQSSFFNDVWAFDIATETWVRLETQGVPPVARYGTSAVVDPVNDRLLISHGFAAGRFDDTFALDLKTNTWQDVSPAERPLRRCLHEAAYVGTSNGGGGRMILFGGCSSGAGPCPQGDTWSFDPETRQWTELKAEGASPAARSNPALLTDSDGQLWLFGGRGAGGAFYNDLWSLDMLTGNWAQHSAAGISNAMLAARSSHDAVWDAANQQIVVFGGLSESGDLNDLWVYALS